LNAVTQVRQLIECPLIRGFVEQPLLQGTLDDAFIEEMVFDLHHATPFLAAVNGAVGEPWRQVAHERSWSIENCSASVNHAPGAALEQPDGEL
jgi:hypothetical protein